jgi:copper chaperone CopZ
MTLTADNLDQFVGNVSANYSNPDQMLAVAQSTYQSAGNVYKESIVSSLHQIIPFTSYSYEQVTVIQSVFFLQQLEKILIIAFVLISIVVFFIFRSVVPSFAVIFGAANDIIVSLGAMAIFKIQRMSIPGRGKRLRREVGKLDGILAVDINYILDTVSIRYDANKLTLDRIKKKID